MKVFLKCIAVVFILAGALFVPAPGADASNFIPINRFQCLLCNREFFTFAPDDLDGDTRREHKDARYQQANWIVFNSSRSPIPRCARDPQGAHIFDNKGTRTVSPAQVRRYAASSALIGLRRGGYTLRVRLVSWMCHVCDRRGFAFEGDNLGTAPPVDLSRRQAVLRLSNGEALPPCRWRGWNNRDFQFHPIGLVNAGGTATSARLLEQMNNLWFSQ